MAQCRCGRQLSCVDRCSIRSWITPRCQWVTSKWAIMPAAWWSRMWQWYIQLPGRSSGSQAMRACPLEGMLMVSSQDRNTRGRPVDGEHLEEEAVQVEGVVHLGLVDHVPDLELADADRADMVVGLPVDPPVDAVQAGPALQVHRSVGSHPTGHQRLDRTEGGRDAGVGRRRRADAHGCIPRRRFFDHPAVVGQRLQCDDLSLSEWPNGEIGPVARGEQHLGGRYRLLQQAAVAAQDGELAAAEGWPHVV